MVSKSNAWCYENLNDKSLISLAISHRKCICEATFIIIILFVRVLNSLCRQVAKNGLLVKRIIAKWNRQFNEKKWETSWTSKLLSEKIAEPEKTNVQKYDI